MDLRIKRVYEPPDPDDGNRILVDRLWPRGLSKERAEVHLWLKEVAPSPALRKWFDHDPDKWEGFRSRYLEELRARPEPVERLREELKKGRVTLVYGAKNTKNNGAVVLREVLDSER